MARQAWRGWISLSGLLGVGLLVGGLFAPWIIRVNYMPHVHCPNGPACPPPVRDAQSYWELFFGYVDLGSPSWWQGVALGIAPVLVIAGCQVALALDWRHGRAMDKLVVIGLVVATLELGAYALAARFYYCLFYCGVGMFVVPGERFLAPGFWLMLVGLALVIASDLALAVGPIRRAGQAPL